MKNILIMGNLWMLKVFKRFTAREPASRRQVEEVLRFLNIINAAFKGSKFFNVHPKKYFVMACLKTKIFLHGQSSKVQSCRWCNPPKHSIRLHWKKKENIHCAPSKFARSHYDSLANMISLKADSDSIKWCLSWETTSISEKLYYQISKY